jgi:hypothetical protein
VDVDRQVLVVRQQIVQLDGQSASCSACGRGHYGIAFGTPKTSSGEARRVDLGDRGVGVLLAQRLVQDAERQQWGAAYSDHGLVFAREDGTPLDPNLVTKRVR